MPNDSGVEWTHPEGGMFSWVTLPKHVDTVEMFPKAIEKKVAYVVGSAFHFDGKGHKPDRAGGNLRGVKILYNKIVKGGS